MSLCGGLENNGPTDDEFDRNIIDYADVCQNPSIFVSPLLVVRLCDKYYSWTAACSIVMTALTFRKPLTNVSMDLAYTHICYVYNTICGDFYYFFMSNIHWNHTVSVNSWAQVTFTMIEYNLESSGIPRRTIK